MQTGIIEHFSVPGLVTAKEASPRRIANTNHLARIRASFDAAKTNADNRLHWASADAYSADAAANLDVRRTLRMRGRYEVANNSYARGMALDLAHHVIGTGPRISLRSAEDSPRAVREDKAVEQSFRDWADEICLAEKLRMARIARVETGEIFLLATYNPSIEHPVKLDLIPIEADQVASPYQNAIDPRQVDGMELDAFGKPTFYHFLRHHPGDLHAGNIDQVDRIPASRVFHYFRPDRPGMHRGIPEITPSLPLYAMLRRYTIAVLGAAEVAASIASVLQTTAPPGEEPDEMAFDEVILDRYLATVLPEGYSLGQLKAEQPTTTYGEFKWEILNEISRCLSIPINIAAGNSSKHNYASGRLDHQGFHTATQVERSKIGRDILTPTWNLWLGEAVLIEGFLPQRYRRRDSFSAMDRSRRRLSVGWHWDGQPHVDPAKEANAQGMRLTNKTTTHAREFAKDGRDWREEFDQMAEEQRYANQIGLTLPSPGTTGANQVEDPTEKDEADDE